HPLHFRKRGNILRCLRDGLRRRAAKKVGHDFDPLLHGAKRLAKIHRDQRKQADGVEREPDRRDRQCRQHGGAAEGLQRFPDEESHAMSSSAVSMPLSKTTAPSRTSTVRYVVCFTRSRSWVAMTTQVPLALISRISWKTPRVARSSRLPVGSSARM